MNRRTLKIIALITMTIDHIGMILFPRIRMLRIIGRISFPIFAYFVGEGYRYTSNKMRYISLMAICEIVCLAGYLVAKGEIYFSIMMTFIISVFIMMLYDMVRDSFKSGKLVGIVSVLGYVVFLRAVDILCIRLDIMYGFWGCMLPLLAYMGKDKWGSLILFAFGIYLQSLDSSGVQIYALFSVIPLAFYDGKKMKGSKFEKYFYYVYYPLHIAALYLVGMFI